MKTALATLALALMSTFGLHAADSVHDFTVQDIEGKDVSLADYDGEVLLIVNVASKCGYTRQYENLVNLNQMLKDQGLVIMGFPANNYGGQEPGTNEEIAEFCSLDYGVDFPMFSKVSVKGDDQAPLFGYLTTAENPDFTGDIKWNFEKILVGKDGKVIHRWRSGTEPDSEEVINAIKEALAS